MAALSLALGACAGTAPGGRPQLTAPSAVSSIYSAVDMDLRLAAVAPLGCCETSRSFDQNVLRIGGHLARAAYELDPQLRQRVPAFAFSVADKKEAGSASNARGNVVIFRGVHRSNPDEKALAFLMAREMAHVIARHHDEKSATGIIMSVLVQLLMPFTSLTGAAAVLTGSTASVVGTEVVNARSDPDQRREADAIAYELVKRLGWNDRQMMASLAQHVRTLEKDAWSVSLKQSVEMLARSRSGRTA